MPDSPQPHPKRIGFFGGSFDPVHVGHISLANQAIEFASIDLLLLCPAFHAPLRSQKPMFPSEFRLQMLQQITKENSKMEVCTLELKKQKTCFTYNTLQEIKSAHPQSELFVLLGADQFEQLEKWKFNQELTKICEFLVFSRSSCEVSIPNLPGLSYHLLKNDLIKISSTQIRNRLQKRKPIDHLVSPTILTIMKTFFKS